MAKIGMLTNAVSGSFFTIFSKSAGETGAPIELQGLIGEARSAKRKVAKMQIELRVCNYFCTETNSKPVNRRGQMDEEPNLFFVSTPGAPSFQICVTGAV